MLQCQAIARLDLDGAHAFVEQRLQTRQREGEQFILTRRTGGRYAGDNAPARLGHLFVAGTGQAQGKFVRALAAIHQMRVAVDQAGRDQRAAPIECRQTGIWSGHGIIRANPGQHAALDHDGRKIPCHQRCIRRGELRHHPQVAPHPIGTKNSRHHAPP